MPEKIEYLSPSSVQFDRDRGHRDQEHRRVARIVNTRFIGNESSIVSIEEAATALTLRVSALEPTLADLITTVAAIPIIQAGMIMMWSGTIATIPDGWALCNGANGTPDLRDKFVVGAYQDDVDSIAKTNIEGSLTKSGGTLSHTHSDHIVTQPSAHSDLTHSGTAVGDHAALAHAGSAVADHTGLTHSGGSASVNDHTGLTHSVSGSSESLTAGTPAGTVSQPTFTGSALGAHSHAIGTYAVPSHSDVTVPASGAAAVLRGTGAATAEPTAHTHIITTITHGTITGSSESLTAGTPAGTISQPTFTGSALTAHSHAAGSYAVADHGTAGTLTHTTNHSDPSAHGTAGTLTHGVTQPSDHTAQSHSVTQPSSHTLSAHSGTAVNAHSSSGHLNPYYALAFIMKL